MSSWRNFGKDQLEREYSPRLLVPTIDPYVARYAGLSAEARRTLAVQCNLKYGPGPDESLDFFPARHAGAPIHVFIHGGYWRALSKDESSFAAPAFVEHGACFAAINYTLAPHARLDEIVRQCRSCISWLYRNAVRLGADPSRIYASGSSAGGHLVAMLLATDWEAFDSLPADILKGGLAVSGIFDLEPVLDCAINAELRLDRDEAMRNSPQYRLRNTPAQLALAWGEVETDEWKRQQWDFAAAWNALNQTCTMTEVAGKNHFDVILDLADPGTELAQLAFGQMGLA